MTSHSDAAATDNNRAAVAGNGKVPSASPTDMFSLDSRFRGNDGAVVVNGDDGVDNGAVVGGGHVRPVVDGATCPDDATVVNDGEQSKIVIPAGSRNPDARTASWREAGAL